MEILQLIPWVLIIIAAFRTVGLAKSSGRVLPRATIAALWVLSIVVPVIAQGAAAAVLAPPLRVTRLHWWFIDTFGMRLGNAQYAVDVFWRTIGAVVGILIARAGSHPLVGVSGEASEGQAAVATPLESPNAISALDLTGPWLLDVAYPDKGITSVKNDLDLQQTGAAIRSATSQTPVTGTIDGSNVVLTLKLDGGADAVHQGRVVDANTLKGTVKSPRLGNGNWTASRKA